MFQIQIISHLSQLEEMKKMNLTRIFSQMTLPIFLGFILITSSLVSGAMASSNFEQYKSLNQNIQTNNSQKNSDNPPKANPNSDSHSQRKSYKHLLDEYPDTTPMQEKLKKAFDIMKNGDPKKPKENNGKRSPENIPEFTVEILSKEDIKINGDVVGKKIKTKTTLIFKNRGQTLFSEKEWDVMGFSKNSMPTSDSALFDEICAKTKGKVVDNGQFCDLDSSFKNNFNSQLSDLYNNWDLDDDSLYTIEGDVDLEKVKKEAKKRFQEKPQLKNKHNQKLIQEGCLCTFDIEFIRSGIKEGLFDPRKISEPIREKLESRIDEILKCMDIE